MISCDTIQHPSSGSFGLRSLSTPAPEGACRPSPQQPCPSAEGPSIRRSRAERLMQQQIQRKWHRGRCFDSGEYNLAVQGHALQDDLLPLKAFGAPPLSQRDRLETIRHRRPAPGLRPASSSPSRLSHNSSSSEDDAYDCAPCSHALADDA